jgi:hypothetical protein
VWGGSAIVVDRNISANTIGQYAITTLRVMFLTGPGKQNRSVGSIRAPPTRALPGGWDGRKVTGAEPNRNAGLFCRGGRFLWSN